VKQTVLTLRLDGIALRREVKYVCIDAA